MLRTLIVIALLAGGAMHLLGVPPDLAAGYLIVAIPTIWLIWPILRRLARLARRSRRRQHSHQHTPAGQQPARPATLTQINHYHYYGHTMPPTWTPDPTQLALPEQGQQQAQHNRIYDA